MSKVKNDLSGKRFGKLLVIEQDEPYISPKGQTQIKYKCVCDCGKHTSVTYSSLMRGVQSCGCVRKGEVRKSNKYEICNVDNTECYRVKVTNADKWFLIDKEDISILKKHRWRISANGYIVTDDLEVRKPIYLHKLLMPDCDDKVVDHINRDRLDNRKENLRYATVYENAINTSQLSTNTSGYRGVTFIKQNSQYMAQIVHNGNRVYLGYYNTIEEAAYVRVKYEWEHLKHDIAPSRHLFKQFGFEE